MLTTELFTRATHLHSGDQPPSRQQRGTRLTVEACWPVGRRVQAVLHDVAEPRDYSAEASLPRANSTIKRRCHRLFSLGLPAPPQSTASTYPASPCLPPVEQRGQPALTHRAPDERTRSGLATTTAESKTHPTASIRDINPLCSTCSLDESGLAPKVVLMHPMGSTRGAKPLCRGHGGVPRIWLDHRSRAHAVAVSSPAAGLVDAPG